MDYDKIIGDVFDKDQCTVLVDIIAGVKAEAEAKAKEAMAAELKERLAENGLEDDFLALTEADRKHAADNAKVNRLKEIWDNHGVNPRTGRTFTMDDMVEYDMSQYSAGKALKDLGQFSVDQPLLIPRVLTKFVREAIEPRMVLTKILQRIVYQHGSHIEFPAIGGFMAADIPEGGEYPERTLETGGKVTADIGKSGVAVKVTEETIRYSLWDVMALNMAAAGRALIRHKEQKVANMLFAQSTDDFDNDGGTPCTGRASDGTANGSFMLDDLLTMMTNAATAGWQPNALIMHPQAWLIFARDPVMRAYGFANNGELWKAFQGEVGNAPQWKGGGFINQPWSVGDPNQVSSTYTPVPTLFPFAPLAIIVSPYVGYTASNNTTDIYMVDLNEVGYLIVDEEVVTEEWKDPARDIHKVKFRERYAVTGAVEPRIRAAKNVVITKAYDFEDRLNWQSGTGALPAISFSL